MIDIYGWGVSNVVEVLIFYQSVALNNILKF